MRTRAFVYPGFGSPTTTFVEAGFSYAVCRMPYAVGPAPRGRVPTRSRQSSSMISPSTTSSLVLERCGPDGFGSSQPAPPA